MPGHRPRPASAAKASGCKSQRWHRHSSLCRSELAATLIVLTESIDRPCVITVPAKPLDVVQTHNHVFVINFPSGSATVELSATEQAKLVEQARMAKFIVIRGRTDATSDSLAQTNLAHRRAEATFSYLTTSLKVALLAEGLRMSWQGAGDPLQLQGTSQARQANRRVEIELYPAKPSVQMLAPAASCRLRRKPRSVQCRASRRLAQERSEGTRSAPQPR
jgi:outer membrane protein OmpA-like peptidoglycan-associated protein